MSFGYNMPNQNPDPNRAQTNSQFPGSTDPSSLYGSDLPSWLFDPNFTKNEAERNAYFGPLDAGGRYEGNIVASRLFSPEFWNLANQYGFYNSLQPLAHQNVNQLLAQLSNPGQMASQYQSQVNAHSGSTLQNVLQRLNSSGAGIGARQGAMFGAANQAATAGNQFRAQLDSPEGRVNRVNAALSLMAGQAPNLGNLSTLAGITTGTPRNQTGLESIGGILGNLAGLASPVRRSSPSTVDLGMPGDLQGPGGSWVPR